MHHDLLGESDGFHQQQSMKSFRPRQHPKNYAEKYFGKIWHDLPQQADLRHRLQEKPVAKVFSKKKNWQCRRRRVSKHMLKDSQASSGIPVAKVNSTPFLNLWFGEEADKDCGQVFNVTNSKYIR